MSRAQRSSRRVIDYGLLDAGASESIYGGGAERFERVLASKATAFVPADVDVLAGSTFDLSWVRRHGLQRPVVLPSREGLGMKLPGPGFTVRDVADVLGGDWPLDIIDVASQQELSGWNLAMWADYFHGAKERRAVLNVISLEFSGTPLAALVRAPRVVRQLDWSDIVWPRARTAAGQYPQVQHYCLMSVGGSYTDWHIDFSGSSVWYHVHTGAKRFLFAPPTEAVLAAYERWTTSPAQVGGRRALAMGARWNQARRPSCSYALPRPSCSYALPSPERRPAPAACRSSTRRRPPPPTLPRAPPGLAIWTACAAACLT